MRRKRLAAAAWLVAAVVIIIIQAVDRRALGTVAPAGEKAYQTRHWAEGKIIFILNWLILIILLNGRTA